MKWRNLLFAAAFLSLAFVSLPAQTQKPSDQKVAFADWNQPFKPFRIIGNIYYVGTNNLACYLITSPGGHVLIDTAMQESSPIVRANIEALGYKLKYIRVILSSHAHFDHVAGHADMKAATGAQVYATAQDAPALESGGAKGFHPLGAYKPVKVDRIIKDGEVVRFGGVALTAHLTPGHTEGNTTWTTTVEENGK
ncbi:MAG: metallo-beta-lactamase, partial [Blastocatellia bacterium]